MRKQQDSELKGNVKTQFWLCTTDILTDVKMASDVNCTTGDTMLRIVVQSLVSPVAQLIPKPHKFPIQKQIYWLL